MKKCILTILALLVAAQAGAEINGQFIKCEHYQLPDANPSDDYYPCPDNWALDFLDESKTDISNPPYGEMPSNRKYYFDTAAIGEGVHIFVLDRGVDGTSPDFKVLDNPGQDRVGVTNHPFGYSDGDGASHGTRVAALAAGLRFGVAKGATIHQVYAKGDLNGSRSYKILDHLDWIEQQVSGGMTPAVLNMSFNIPLSEIPQTTKDALDAKVRRLINTFNVVVTVSAGNQKSTSPDQYWPSNIDEAIVVGGIDVLVNRWQRASDDEYSLCTNLSDCGSNYGDEVDLWAPAEFIRSALKNNDASPEPARSGTSYAAPIVAGLAALHLEQFPSDSPAQVLAALKANAALRNVDGMGAWDYVARSPQLTPACNVPQRMFADNDNSTEFLSEQMYDSCPEGFYAYSDWNASHGEIDIGGLGPGGALYFYTPDAGYVGFDQSNYTIYDSSGTPWATGTIKITVQPPHN